MTRKNTPSHIMTSIDDSFQKAGIPSKRKHELTSDPNEVFKSRKHHTTSLPTRHSRRSNETTKYDREYDDDHDNDDAEAGPFRPPPADDVEPPLNDDNDEDDEGRFFEGGLTETEAKMLDYVDSVDASAGPGVDDDVKFNVAWLRKAAVALERKINRNEQQRAKYAPLNQPEKFIDSEADVDEAVRELAVLGQFPTLYPEFVALGCPARLVGLLTHENADIAVATLRTLADMVDENSGATDVQWDSLVDALLDADLLDLVASTFSRLDEDADEGDRDGIYHALTLLEGLCSGRAERIGSHNGIVRWLLARVAKVDADADGGVAQNRQYAAELLGILCSSNKAIAERIVAGVGKKQNNRKSNGKRKGDAEPEINALDLLLQIAAYYRKRDPKKGGDEEEFVGNVFEALTAMVDTPLGKQQFVDLEGPELILIVLREKERKDNKMVKSLSLRLLTHAAAACPTSSLSANDSSANDLTNFGASLAVCTAIVQNSGLKTLFALFMHRSDSATIEHLLDIMASMLRHLPFESPERIRMLAKFVEKDYDKTARLVTLRGTFAARLQAVDAQLRTEERVRHDAARASGLDGISDDERRLFEFESLSRRLDEGGLFALQLIDQILAWLVLEDQGLRSRIVSLLGTASITGQDNGAMSLGDVKNTLVEQMEGLDAEDDEAKELKDILVSLVTHLGTDTNG